ncbi:MAG TPA: replication initiation protein RepC [Methylocella sp.]
MPTNARNGISSWRDLVATAATVRSIIGISPSGWEDANIDLGPEDSAVLVAAIVQPDQREPVISRATPEREW